MSGSSRRGSRLLRSWTGAARAALREAVSGAAGRLSGTSARPPRPPSGAAGRAAPAEATPSGVRRDRVEALLGTRVGELALYEHALRHRSIFRGQTTDGTESNERLEFLGDAVLGAAVADRLYRHFGDRDEGFLTRTRAHLVNGKALASYAETLGLGALVLLSDNMHATGGRHNTTILADAFEAIVGALYLDRGFEAARQFVDRVLDVCVDLDAVAERRTNYKSQLLEYVQARQMGQPSYTVLDETGPSHDRRFTVAAVVDGAVLGHGVANAKKAAEQAAARKALAALEHGAGTPAPPPAPAQAPAPVSADSSDAPDNAAPGSGVASAPDKTIGPREG